MDPFTGVHCTGFTDGDCLWDLSLGQCTGDGKFDGETFWVGCGWFFLGGVGEGKRRLQGTLSMVCFFAGRHEFPNCPFFVIYYILSSGGFSTSSSDHLEGTPGPRRTGQSTCAVQALTTRLPLPRIEDGEGPDEPRSTTDSTDQWVWCFTHMWFMLHVISVICLV